MQLGLLDCFDEEREHGCHCKGPCRASSKPLKPQREGNKPSVALPRSRGHASLSWRRADLWTPPRLTRVIGFAAGILKRELQPKASSPFLSFPVAPRILAKDHGRALAPAFAVWGVCGSGCDCDV